MDNCDEVSLSSNQGTSPDSNSQPLPNQNDAYNEGNEDEEEGEEDISQLNDNPEFYNEIQNKDDLDGAEKQNEGYESDGGEGANDASGAVNQELSDDNDGHNEKEEEEELSDDNDEVVNNNIDAEGINDDNDDFVNYDNDAEDVTNDNDDEDVNNNNDDNDDEVLTNDNDEEGLNNDKREWEDDKENEEDETEQVVNDNKDEDINSDDNDENDMRILDGGSDKKLINDEDNDEDEESGVKENENKYTDTAAALHEKLFSDDDDDDDEDDNDFVSKTKKRSFPIESDEEEANARGKRLRRIESDEEEGDKKDGHQDVTETNKELFGSDDDDADAAGGGDNDVATNDDTEKERTLFGSDIDDIDDDDDDDGGGGGGGGASGGGGGGERERVREKEKEMKKKRRHRHGSSGDDDDDEEEDDVVKEGKEVAQEDNDASGLQDEKIVYEIFGMSDDEDNFEGFNEEEEAGKKHKKGKKTVKSNERVSDDDDDDDGGGGGGGGSKQAGFVSDFQQMMETKKASKKRRFRKGEGEFVNDSDDVVDEMLNKMREALQKDVESIKEKKPAFQVMKLLPYVKTMLLRVDLHQAMIDLGILSHITEWLAPFPDNSLPHLEVRETLLKQLVDFTSISTEGLKMSGLGKAVMHLFKHPKENRRNKEVCHTLINRWAKPIFSQGSEMRLTKEEREQRDKELVSAVSHHDSEKREPETVLRPGDPGFIIRARVPQPSNMDYVNRPRWNVEERSTDGPSKKRLNKLQKYQRIVKTGMKS